MLTSERASKMVREGEPHPYCRHNRLTRHCWKKYGQPEDFYKYLRELAQMYSYTIYRDNGEYWTEDVSNENRLFIDYKKWRDLDKDSSV